MREYCVLRWGWRSIRRLAPAAFLDNRNVQVLRVSVAAGEVRICLEKSRQTRQCVHAVGASKPLCSSHLEALEVNFVRRGFLAQPYSGILRGAQLPSRISEDCKMCKIRAWLCSAKTTKANGVGRGNMREPVMKLQTETHERIAAHPLSRKPVLWHKPGGRHRPAGCVNTRYVRHERSEPR